MGVEDEVGFFFFRNCRFNLFHPLQKTALEQTLAPEPDVS